MASINKVMVMGRLGQDPELRYTQNQTAVCSLNVATTEYRMGQDGQRQEMTEWHRVVVWGKQAENASKYLAKGRGVFIEGRLQTRSWEDQNGQKRYTTEIVANNVQFLPSGQSQGQNNTHQQQGGSMGGGMGGGQTGSNYNSGEFAPADNGGGFPSSGSSNMGSSDAFDDIPF
jgi:single-strand DNA-binding protein